MNKLHLLFSVFLGTFVYVLMTLFFGVNGFNAFEQLDEQHHNVAARNSELKKQNDELNIRKHSLAIDDDVIRAYARKIGFVSDNEKLIKVNGLANISDEVLKVEKPYFRLPVSFVPEWVCKLCGFMFFLMFEILFILKKVSKKSFNFRKVDQNA